MGNSHCYRMLLVLAVLGIFGISHRSVAATISTADCLGAVPTHLAVGMAGQVSITPQNQTPLPIRIHAAPSLEAKVVFSLTDGTPFTVIGGPKCADNLTWWQITTALGQGWAAEGDVSGSFIVPVTPTSATTTVPLTITDLPAPQPLCPDTLPSFIAVRHVKSEDSVVSAIIPVTLYSAADTTSDMVAKANPGDVIQLVKDSDSTCAGGRLWWRGQVLSAENFSLGPVGHFAEADSTQYAVNPNIMYRRRYMTDGTSAFNINFAGIQMPSSVIWDGPDAKSVLAEWFGRGFYFGQREIGSTEIDIHAGCTDCGSPETGGEIEVYQVQDNLLLSGYHADIQRIKALIAQPPGNQNGRVAVEIFGMAGARPVLNTRFKKLTFKGGSLIRYVTIYAQADAPISDGSGLIYVAEGLTDDNQRLVTFTRFVTLSDLKGNDNSFPQGEDIDAHLPAYYAATSQIIARAPNAHFSIPLDALDAAVESIQIGPLPPAP